MAEWMKGWRNARMNEGGEGLNRGENQAQYQRINEKWNEGMSGEFNKKSIYEKKDDRISFWMNEWMNNRRVNESMNGWTTAWMNAYTNDRMSEYMNEWKNEQMNGQIQEWMNEWMS